VPRFRLRFLLQEFDLPPGETIVGRSPDCHITIDDPLLSRHHGKIVVSGVVATYLDLGSRNGSRINNRLVSEPTLLSDTDRLRLGAQELVFIQVGTDRRMMRSTGAMRLCDHCKTPFPDGPETCPHCGRPAAPSPSLQEDETMAGVETPPRRWILQLLGEMLERALAAGKLQEAERWLRKAADDAEERVASRELDAKQLAQVSDYALQLAAQERNARWVQWVLEMHRRAERAPTRATADRLEALLAIPGVGGAVAQFIRQFSIKRPLTGDHEQLLRLARLVPAAPTPDVR
jgi:hypothetical protein